MAREGNNVKRRVAEKGAYSGEDIQKLLGLLQYIGSGDHKESGKEYGFTPSYGLKPGKSPCDRDVDAFQQQASDRKSRRSRRADKRYISPREAKRLFERGIKHGMMSDPLPPSDTPKYVWSMDEEGRVYEAKCDDNTLEYHGYRLGKKEAMRQLIINGWSEK